MLLLFWNGSGTPTGAVRIVPNMYSIGLGGIGIYPIGRVKLLW